MNIPDSVLVPVMLRAGDVMFMPPNKLTGTAALVTFGFSGAILLNKRLERFR